jgi:hypothetical protein
MINDDFDSALFNALTDPASATPCRSDGGDLRLLLNPRDESTRVGLEIENFVQSATAGNRRLQLWCEVGELPVGGSVDIYLVWGNSSNTQPARDAQYGSDQVWNQLPGGIKWDFACHTQGTTTMNDSSSENNTIIKPDYTNHGPYESTTDIPFKSGHAQLFTSATQSVLEVPGLANDFSGDLCVMFWLRKPASNAATGFERIVSNKNGFSDSAGFEVTCVPNEPFQLQIQGQGSNSSVVFLTQSVWDGNWHHYAVQINNSGDAWIIQDGVLHPAASNVGVIQATGNQVVIGNDSDRNESGLVGRLSEFRMIDENLSEDLVDVMYNNMNNPGGLATVTFL